MKYIVLIFIIIKLVYCASDCTNENNKAHCKRDHTDVYLNWKDGSFNETIFLNYTFITDYDICKTYTRKQYIKLLNDNGYYCTGDWCNNDKYSCQTYPCYEVEHIIDTQNSIYNEYNKDILGNMIMAYSKWNKQIGKMKWDYVEIEKREIYGDNVVDMAIKNIEKCNNIPNKYIESNSYNGYSDYYIIQSTSINCEFYIEYLIFVIISLVAIILLLLVTIILIICKCHKYKYSDNIEL